MDDLVDRGGRALGRRWRWLRPLARRLLAAFGPGARPRAARLAASLRNDDGFRRACDRHSLELGVGRALPATMAPAPGPPSTWKVPAITSPKELARLLGLKLSELEWFADPETRGRRSGPGPLRHYDYRWVAKASGSARLIEAPRPRLKAIQRGLLVEVLSAIPPHDAAHGFRAGRSVRTHVEPHVGRRVVLKLDLRDFFPSISVARVAAIFCAAGYPEAVARLLAGLSTNSVPADAWDQPGAPPRGPNAWQARRLYREPHLPQGAPTSPALANLGAFRLDCRLAGLAASTGARYTRYADDLTFSGDRDFERAVGRILIHVGAIALEEGFEVNTRKTRVMRQGVRQRVAGVVLNGRLNVARNDYDALKATLHNCARHGPGGQDRAGHADFRAHLAGRVAHVASLNPERGRRLQDLFERIEW